MLSLWLRVYLSFFCFRLITSTVWHVRFIFEKYGISQFLMFPWKRSRLFSFSISLCFSFEYVVDRPNTCFCAGMYRLFAIYNDRFFRHFIIFPFFRCCLTNYRFFIIFQSTTVTIYSSLWNWLSNVLKVFFFVIDGLDHRDTFEPGSIGVLIDVGYKMICQTISAIMHFAYERGYENEAGVKLKNLGI